MKTLSIDVPDDVARILRKRWETYMLGIGKFVPFATFAGEILAKQYETR